MKAAQTRHPSNSLVLRLLTIRRPADAQDLVSDLERQGCVFVPVGDDPSNAGRIEMAAESRRPMMERAINAIDALLEHHYATDPRGNTLKSPRQATAAWFQVPEGRLASVPETRRRDLADNIVVTISDSGNPKKPNLSIRDKGIGIHTDDVRKTILALGGSNKVTKFHLCGAYGQGGSTAFGFSEFSILVTRQQPDTLRPGQADNISWTLIRRESPANTKNDVYAYIVQPNGSVPHLSARDAPEFDPGTYVIHLGYEMGKFAGRMTIVGYRLFNSLLFDPILPLWLVDERYPTDGGRTISGNVSRLRDSQNVEYENEYRQANGPLEGLRIRYWVMKPKDQKTGGDSKFYLDSYLDYAKSPHSVVVTLNGQVHGTMDRSFLKSRLDLSFLRNFLLVQIETDGLSNDARRQLFASTRERVREGERLDLLREKLEEILREDPEILRLEKARREQFIASSDTSADDKVRRLLDRLITTATQATVGADRGTGMRPPPRFKSKDPPKTLEIVTKENPILLNPNELRTVTLRCNAPDDYFTRPKKRGTLTAELSPGEHVTKLRISGPSSGLIKIVLKAQPAAPIGSQDHLRIVLRTHRKKELVAERDLLVASPPSKPPTFDPPTQFDIANPGDPMELKKGRRAVIHLHCNGPDGYLNRTEKPGRLAPAMTGRNGILVNGHTDLRNGRILCYLDIPKDLSTGTTDEFTCTLTLPDETQCTTTRPCVVVDAPEAGPGPDAQTYRPNYEIIPVFPGDARWKEREWDDKYVGAWETSGGKLYLLISLGYDRFQAELNDRRLTPDRLAGFKTKYQAMIAYHLWQHHRDLKERNADAPEDRDLQEEFRRAANTILLSTKPEAELSVDDA